MPFDELLNQSIPFDPDDPDPRFPSGGGVYLLTDGEDRLVQLAAAADLRRALRARFAQPEEQPGQEESPSRLRRLNLGEIVRRIRWRPAYSVFELSWAYYQIARRLMPADYLEQLAFGPAWFVHVDPAAAIPRLTVSKLLAANGGSPGVDLGPFATQADASRFVQILQDAFDLCRYEHILEQAPHGQACAYFEMGRCPAPCDGSLPMPAYRETVSAAVAFARGERAPVYAHLDEQMREAATRRAFEQAAILKQRLQRARSIEHEAFRHVRAIEEFNYLILQRGGGRTRVKPFFVRRGMITDGPPVTMKEVARSAPRWIEQVRAGAPAADVAVSADSRRERSEHIWLVSHSLFKRSAPGLFLHAHELADAGEVIRRVKERFQTPLAPKTPVQPLEASIDENPSGHQAHQ